MTKEEARPFLIRDFLDLKETVNNAGIRVGFVCKNGKRLITRDDYGRQCFIINSSLRVVLMKDEEVYSTPFDLIMDYFTDNESVSISEILLFASDREALNWLLKELERKEGNRGAAC